MRISTFLLRTIAFASLIFFGHLPQQIIGAPPSGSSPANITKEGDLVILTLSPEGEQRLRLKVHPLAATKLRDVRTFAGQVLTPLGSEGQIAVPFNVGNLSENLLLADNQAIADGLVRESEVNVEAATIALKRAEQVRLANAGSTRTVDEAKAALQIAEVRLETAQIRRALLGSSLLEAKTLEQRWVRVAIYAGEASVLDPTATATVQTIGHTPESFKASPIAGPSTADTVRSTVDWYYRLPTNTRLRAGEQVSVTVPTKASSTEQLVVPFTAVLYDIHGGQWVYERIKEHVYTRRRVEVLRIEGPDAVLARGPSVGSRVVTDGAAELFGTEFMTGK